MKSKLGIYLNSILFCLWIWQIKSGKTINHATYSIFKLIFFLFSTRTYRKKKISELSKKIEELDIFFDNPNDGFNISLAQYILSYSFCGYSIFPAFTVGGILIRCSGELNTILLIIPLCIFVFLSWFILLNLVYHKDKYTQYFKKFEKKIFTGKENGIL